MIKKIQKLMASIGYDECVNSTISKDFNDITAWIGFRKPTTGMYARIDISRNLKSGEWQADSFLEEDDDDFEMMSKALTETELRVIIKVIDLLNH